MWRSDASDFPASIVDPSPRVEVDVEYGVPAFADAGSITPHGRVEISEARRVYGLGVRLGLGSALAIDMRGERLQPAPP